MTRAPDPAPVTPPRLVVLVGKGGVGRSTLAAALGLVSAGRGRRTLLVEVAASQVVPGWFEVRERGYRPVRLAPNLHAHRVGWEDALREYGLMKLHVRALYRLVFENPFVRRLLPAIPGVAEILVMGKVIWSVTDGVDGLGPVDTVILDAPATGHGISLLTSPDVVSATVPTGPLAEDARRLRGLLRDPATTRFHLVTTPEEMPVAESEEIHRVLAGRHDLPFGPILANQVLSRGLRAEQRDTLAVAARSALGTPDSCAAVSAALLMADRAQLQRAHLQRLRHRVPLPLIELPDVRGGRTPRQRIDVLAQHLAARLWREGR
jgi:anion-transporting  ArsA/GET3 family ATPase